MSIFAPLRSHALTVEKCVTRRTDHQRVFFLLRLQDVIFRGHIRRRATHPLPSMALSDMQDLPTYLYPNSTPSLMKKRFALTVASCLAACGGGGGGGAASTPEVVNRAPVFDQASYALSIQENSGTVVSGIAFSDPDGDPITLSISGPDSQAFSVTSLGSLAFINPPDFEAPDDSDANNDYDITLAASDGALTASVSVIITVTNDVSDDEVGQGSLFGLTVQVGEVNTPAYDRPSTWDDQDGDCISDRHEILIAQHLEGQGAHPLIMSSSGCFVETGRWLDPYDDIYYYNASDVQIDHVVALYESWVSGLGNLDAALQRRYANTGSLTEGILPETSHNFLAVGASSNGEKGSSDPTQWMPRNEAYHCTYLKKWVLNKSQNGLLFDQAEFDFIQSRASDCGDEPLPELPANP